MVTRSVTRYFSVISPAVIFCLLSVWSTSISKHFPSTIPEDWNRPNTTISSSVKIFYNVYANLANDTLGKEYVTEQMAQLLPEHKVFIRSIGARFQVESATNLQHDTEGTEVQTLKLLWDHCVTTDYPTNEKVVYIHNKGSFHPNEENDLMRLWLTRGALSKECSNMPLSCNVCSFRMSPLPHPHTPGNMWAARCEYVRELINPLDFQLKMALLYHNGDVTAENPLLGTGRYSAEHWVHSHPSIKACDLSTSDFAWGYDGLPGADDDHELKLEAAPRYNLNFYSIDKKEVKIQKGLRRWLKQYRYHKTDGLDCSLKE